MDNSNGRKSWTEYFRIITPFLLIVITGFASVINSKLNSMDEKLFKHLTNDEIHTPRSVVITRAEFDIYQSFRNKQNDEIKCDLRDIKSLLMEHMEGGKVSRVKE